MDILDSIFEEPPPAQRPDAYDPKWSIYQTAIFDAVHNPEANLLISAGAGCGKSTTLVQAMRYAPGTSLFMAFNKSIAEELRPKVGTAGDVKTLNALGHGLIYKNLGRTAQLDARKVSTLIRRLMGDGHPDLREYGYTLTRLVGLMKNNALGIDGERVELQEVCDLADSSQLDIPFGKLEQLCAYALRAFQISIEEITTFDFDDQLYLPLYHKWSYPYYSNVFVDECQDLSPIQHLMLSALKAEGSRLVAVGDRYQAIYGFRGALSNSMDLLAKRFQMTELPLSLSYRCATEIVREASDYCDGTLQALSDAPLGEVLKLEEEPELFSNCLILSRNNAPLFSSILRHIRAKSPCRVQSNFTETFPAFIKGFKSRNTTELSAKLDQWYENEKAAAEKRGFFGKLAALKDKYDTCKLLANEFVWVDDMLDEVAKLSTSMTGPLFSTVHRAKGMEHERVFILRPDTMPSSYASTPEAKRQEMNIIYVAITRAKRSLTWGPALV